MKNKAVIFAMGLILGCGFSFAQSSTTGTTKIARGKYLVHDVAHCGKCHSEHDKNGEPRPRKQLRGAALEFKPIAPTPNWVDKAPDIAGLPGWDDTDAVKFFMTGLAHNNLPARPPMPGYRMNKPDAEAVVAYLRSLSPVAK